VCGAVGNNSGVRIQVSKAFGGAADHSDALVLHSQKGKKRAADTAAGTRDKHNRIHGELAQAMEFNSVPVRGFFGGTTLFVGDPIQWPY